MRYRDTDKPFIPTEGWDASIGAYFYTEALGSDYDFYKVLTRASRYWKVYTTESGVSHTLMAPALLLYLYLPGNWAYLGAFMGGFFALASMPLGVLMAQALAPRGRAMVSSLMMGLAYGLGGLFSPLVGKLADIFSIETTLTWMVLTPVLSLLFILRFPDIKAD